MCAPVRDQPHGHAQQLRPSRGCRDGERDALFVALRPFCHLLFDFGELSPATLDDHEGDTLHEHEFVNVLSP